MQEKNYLSVTMFVLIIFVLLLGGNYLIRNKGQKPTTKIVDIRMDNSKDYVYFTDIQTVSEDLDLVYNTIHLNLESKDAKELENLLNEEMIKAKKSIKTLDEVVIDKKDIAYELGDNNKIYEADYLKYDILESDNYITVGTIKGHINITNDEDNNTLKYYTFSKKDGHIMSLDEIKSAGKITNNSIEKVKENYLKDKENTTIKTYELYIDKYGNTIMNLLVNSGDITYNDTVKIN